MINTRKQLKEYLAFEKKIYIEASISKLLEQVIVSDWRLCVYKYIKSLRKQEFYHNNRGIFHKIIYSLYRRNTNRLGLKLGIEAWDNTFGIGLTIYHPGNIVVNGMSQIGKNLKLHGNNCIGNSGLSNKAPRIGDNVRLGVGAAVIGDVYIADDIIVAAGAIVVDSCYEKGAVLAGVPAKIVKHGKEKN